jgi:ribosomal-protein-serine acetyltransferase
MIFERHSGEVVGAAGLHVGTDPECPEIGYWVRSDRTGRGYATRAARALVEAAFSLLPEARQVTIRMDHANLASAAIPPKLGFSLQGEEVREVVAQGHTGKGFVWVLAKGDAP